MSKLTKENLERWLMERGLSPDEAQNIVRGSFRNGLKILNEIKKYDKNQTLSSLL